MLRMISRTRWVVSALIRGLPESTRLTVEGDTPDIRAISLMVTFTPRSPFRIFADIFT